MKLLRKAIFTLLAIVVGLPAIGWLLFRMPVGRVVEGEGFAYLKKIDLDVDLRDEYFERPLGKKKLYVSEDRVFFVSAENWTKVWGEEDRRNIRYRVHPVLAGFGVAEIVSAENRSSGKKELANQSSEPTATDPRPSAESVVPLAHR